VAIFSEHSVAIPCWPGRQEPSLTSYNVCWMPQPVSSVILGSSTEAWHIIIIIIIIHSQLHWLDVFQGILHKLGVTVHRSGVSKARLPSTSWTAATPHRTLPVVSDFDLLAATSRRTMHDIVAARSAVGRSPSPVRWPEMRCPTTSETRRSVPTISGRL